MIKQCRSVGEVRYLTPISSFMAHRTSDAYPVCLTFGQGNDPHLDMLVEFLFPGCGDLSSRAILRDGAGGLTSGFPLGRGLSLRAAL